MAGGDLGTARGKVVMDYDGKGVEEGKQGLEGIKKEAGSTGVAMKKTAKVTGVAGLAIAAGLGFAVKSAATFEQRVSAIKAVSGATAAEMDLIRDAALRIGAETAFNAEQAAQAMEELSKAGVSTKDILNGAADATVALASAGEVDLPFAAEIAANAMGQFNLAAKDLPRVADLIAGSANASAIDVKQFGQSLSQAGAVANLAGVSFDDLSVAIGLMGNAGIKGSDAGTSLKTFMQNLQPVTNKQIELFEELGLVTEDGTNKFYDQAGNLRSLSEVAGVLGSSMEGMTQQQKQLALETLFGSDAIRAAAVIANEGSDGFDAMAASMDKVSAAEVAETRMDNLEGGIEELSGSIETISIQLGTILIPYLKSLAAMLTTAANWFGSLSDGMQKGFVEAAAFAAGALLMVAAVTKATLAFRAMSIAMSANPIGFIITAIALLVVAIIWLYRNNETFRNIVQAVWKAVKIAVKATVDWITNTAWPALKAFFLGIASAAQDVWGVIGPVFRGIWKVLKAVFLWIKNTAIPIIVDITRRIISDFKKIFKVVKAVFTPIAKIIGTVISFITTAITTGVNAWVSVFKAVLGGLRAFWNFYWDTFGGYLTAVFNLIKTIILLALKIIINNFRVQFQFVKFLVTNVWNFIKTATETAWNFIRFIIEKYLSIVKKIVTTVFNAVKKVVTTVSGAIKKAVITAWEAIRGPVTAVLNFLRSLATKVFEAILAVVRRVMGPIVNVIKSGWNTVREAVSEVWGRIRTAVSKGIERVLKLAGGIGRRAKSAIGNLGRILFNKGRDLIQGLIDGITSKINAFTDKLNQLKEMIPGSPVKVGPLRVLNRSESLLTPAGENLVEGFISGIRQQIPLLQAMLSRVSMSTTPGALAVPVRNSTAPSPAIGGGQTNIFNVYNPIPETTTESTARAMRRLAFEGAFG